MVTTGGKVCIIVGILVIMGAVIVAENVLIKIFGLIAGLIVIIQGLRMKPIPISNIATTNHLNPDYFKPNNHYAKGVVGWDIKKDKNSKGVI